MVEWKTNWQNKRANDTRYKMTTDASTTRAFKRVFRVVSHLIFAGCDDAESGDTEKCNYSTGPDSNRTCCPVIPLL